MKKVLCVILAVLVVAMGVGGYFYSDIRYEKGVEKGVAELNTKVDLAKKAGYKKAEDELGYTIEKAKAKLTEIAAAPEPLQNPTYAKMMDLLLRDQTNKTISKESPVWWVAPAVLLRENAIKEGIRAGVAILHMEKIHVINIFETTDEGIVYVEPRFDYVVKVKKGKSYKLENSPPFDKNPPPFDDTIKDILIIW